MVWSDGSWEPSTGILEDRAASSALSHQNRVRVAFVRADENGQDFGQVELDELQVELRYRFENW